MTTLAYARCLNGIIVREALRFLNQRGRFVAALVRPLVWLFIFAAGFRAVLGVSIIPPYETYVLYEVYIAPGLMAMIQLFNGMQSSLSMVYDREMGSMRTLLAQRLKEMEEDGVVYSVERTKGRGREYFLTPAGLALHPVLEALSGWGQTWGQGRLRPDDLDAIQLMWAMKRHADETAPIELSLASVGLFPSVAVFLAPVVTAQLIDLHAGVHRRLGGMGGGALDHYRPGVWVPHCTLASDLAPEQFASALAIAGRAPLPLECRLVEVGIVEFRPVKQLVSRVLAGVGRAGL